MAIQNILKCYLGNITSVIINLHIVKKYLSIKNIPLVVIFPIVYFLLRNGLPQNNKKVIARYFFISKLLDWIDDNSRKCVITIDI